MQKMRSDGRYERQMNERWGSEWQKQCKWHGKAK